MSLIENNLFGTVDKVRNAIEIMQMLEPPDGYYLAFSGGKDSQCIYHLAKMAGVKFDAHYSLTTVDPPELVYFIRNNYPDVIFEHPKLSMWQLIIKNKIPPSRKARYCCVQLKEIGGKGRFAIIGVRWAESRNREKREMVESCPTKQKRILNTIISWTDSDVWEFLNTNKIPHCKLYDEGYTRIGCIMCPLKSKRLRELDAKKYPKYYKAYLAAFDKMLKKRNYTENGKTTIWKTPQDVMDSFLKA